MRSGDATKDVEAAATAVVHAAWEVRDEMGVGLPERYYHRAMEIVLGEQGVRFVSKPAVPIVFRGERLGDVFPDMIVADRVVLEFKACEELHGVHEAQTLTYLAATGRPLALLFNFHAVPFRNGIRRFIRRGPALEGPASDDPQP